MLALLGASIGFVLISPIRTTVENAYEAFGIVWTGPDSFALDQVILRWSLPQSPYVDESLASGISYALTPQFCDEMLPHFPESSILPVFALSCVDLRDAIAAAFRNWAINHKKLSFEDVTDECNNPANASSRTCNFAEVIIKTDEGNLQKTGSDLVAYAEHDLTTLIPQPTTTAGQTLVGLGVAHASLTLRNSDDLCWYLDSSFCSWFHRLDEDGTDVEALVRSVLGIAFVLSILLLLYVVVCIVMAALQAAKPMPQQKAGGRKQSVMIDYDQTCCRSERITAMVVAFADMPLATVLLALLLTIFSPIFYVRVFLPCWECYDFKATMTHEIGHVLGFHHPDTKHPMNLNATQPMGNQSCLDPLSHVQLAPNLTGVDSIMLSMTKHRDKVCLTAYDLEGLNFLYPTCNDFIFDSEPLCIQAKSLLGWLRLICTVAFPYVLTTGLLLLCLRVVRLYQKRRLKNLEDYAIHLRQERRELAARAARRVSNFAFLPGHDAKPAPQAYDVTY